MAEKDKIDELVGNIKDQLGKLTLNGKGKAQRKIAKASKSAEKAIDKAADKAKKAAKKARR